VKYFGAAQEPLSVSATTGHLGMLGKRMHGARLEQTVRELPESSTKLLAHTADVAEESWGSTDLNELY
jgi:hypothetical protein